MSGIAQAGGTVFHLEPLGPMAMRMIDYMVAEKFASLVPGCRISNVDIPAWGLHLPAIGSPGTAPRQRHLLPVDLAAVAAAMRAGARTLAAIAGALNARGVRTARGGQWYATTVRNVLQRAP